MELLHDTMNYISPYIHRKPYLKIIFIYYSLCLGIIFEICNYEYNNPGNIQSE